MGVVASGLEFNSVTPEEDKEKQLKENMLLSFQMVAAAVRKIIEKEPEDIRKNFFEKLPELGNKTRFLVIVESLINTISLKTKEIIQNGKDGEGINEDLIIVPQDIKSRVKEEIEVVKMQQNKLN